MAETTSLVNNRIQAVDEISWSKLGNQMDIVRLDRKTGETGNENAVFFGKEYSGNESLSPDGAALSSSGNVRMTSAM